MLEPAENPAMANSLTPSAAHPVLDREKVEAVRRHLAEIVASKEFRSTRRGRQFLEYVVERALEGRDDLLKERIIGVEVFGRDDAYDPSADSIVRVGANDVRKRLAAFYQSSPSSPLSIVLPPGSYLPEFRWEDTRQTPTPAPPRRSWQTPLLLLITLLLTLLLGAVAFNRTLAPPPPAPSALERFWEPATADSHPVLIGLGHSVAYQPRQRQWDRLATIPPPPASAMVRLEDRYVSAADALVAARLSEMFARRQKPLSVRVGSSLSFGELRKHPTLLIGAFNNQWTLEMTRDLRFSFHAEQLPSGEERLAVVDRNQHSRPWSLTRVWPSANSNVDYAIVTRLFDPHSGKVMVFLAGILQYGTEAAGAFLTDPGAFAEFERRAPKDWDQRNLQVVLQTNVIRQAPAGPRVLAVHVWDRHQPPAQP
jgi:hypothetical protein